MCVTNKSSQDRENDSPMESGTVMLGNLTIIDYFKNLFEDEIKQGKLVLKEPNFMLEWQLFHHCGWDKVEFYPDDPSAIVS